MVWTNTDMALAVLGGWAMGVLTVCLLVIANRLETSNRLNSSKR